MALGCLKGLSVVSVWGKMGDLIHYDYAGIAQPSELLITYKKLFSNSFIRSNLRVH